MVLIFMHQRRGGSTEPIRKFERKAWQELLAVAAGIELGLFESLARLPAAPSELAERLDCDQRGTEMLLLALADLGHLAIDEAGRFSVVDETAGIVVNRESPGYAPNAILHSRNLMERWLTIPKVVRTGRQEPRPYTRARREVFIRSMDDSSRGAAEKIVDLCLKRSPGIRTALDIGGGPGTYAKLFAERGVEVTILDRHEVIEITEPELAAWPGITMIPGDFNQGLPDKLFDLVFMGNIFHIYGPDENRKLLRRVRGILNPGGVTAIVDLVRNRSSRAALFALTMLVNTDSGGVWTEEEYRGWLEEADLTGIEIIDIEERDAQLILASLPH